MNEEIIKMADQLGINPEDLKKAIEKTKTVSKTKYLLLGKCKPLMVSGIKHLLPLYREAINNINQSENERVFNQLAAREGIEEVEDFIEKMNNYPEYRTKILRKYKIQ